MAFSSLKFASSLLLLIASASLLISPATSQTCKSQTFTQDTTFANCVDLPTLNASLHWTYDSSVKPNPTLTVAFTAPPASPDGWVSWALNPTATGMLGAQALVAFRDSSSGSAVVKTYNVTSYSIAESAISYEVLSKRAEYSGGVIRIFATLGLPAAGAEAPEVNQVWQVGPSVSNGMPAMHALGPENLSSRGILRLVSTRSSGSGAPAPTSRGGKATPAPTSSGGKAPTSSGGKAPTAPTSSGGKAPTSSGEKASTAPTSSGGNDAGGSSMIRGFGLYGILLLLGVVLGF